jgi:hypothetical protein
MSLIKIKRGNFANLPMLAPGEPAFTLDTETLYIGKSSGNGNIRFYNSDDVDALLSAKASSADLSAHVGNTNNPHGVTKSQIGLGNVDNTSDLNKPISTATQTALNAKANEADLTAHVSDTNNPHGVTKAQVGLGNADNTSDLNKPVSTATQNALDAKQSLSEKGQVNGYASLDGSGKVPASQLPESVIGGMTYVSVWDASANTPAIAAAAAGNKGHYYKVSVAGSTNIDGCADWKVGDWIVSNGTTWDKVDNTDSVSSVAGKTGAVTLVIADIQNLETELAGKLSEVADDPSPQLGGDLDVSTHKIKGYTASRALVSSADGEIAASAVTATEVGYLAGVTSSIQTQLTGKQSVSQKGQANGYASLDANGLVPVAQLPDIDGGTF